MIKIISSLFFILLGIILIIYAIVLEWQDTKGEALWVRIVGAILEMIPTSGSSAIIGYSLILLGIIIIVK